MNKKQKDNNFMDNKEKNFTQEEINEIFVAVKKQRRIRQRELTKKEIEKLILKAHRIAQD